jgi:hypothetical protein
MDAGDRHLESERQVQKQLLRASLEQEQSWQKAKRDSWLSDGQRE